MASQTLFKEIDGGVEMEDIVDYKLPFGIIGQMIQPLVVAPKLKEIFNYRRQKLIELFGDYPGEIIKNQDLKENFLT